MNLAALIGSTKNKGGENKGLTINRVGYHGIHAGGAEGDSLAPEGSVNFPRRED